MALGALAIGAALTFAAPAAAATGIFISNSADVGDSVGGFALLHGASTADLAAAIALGGTADENNAHALSFNPQLLTVNDGATLSNPTTEMLAWCLQPLVKLDLNVSFDDDFNMTIGGRAYTDLTGPLTNFRSNAALSNNSLAMIGRLINYGTTLAAAPATTAVQLASIQGAIWQIANPDYDFYLVDNVGAPTVFDNANITLLSGGVGVPILPSNFRAMVSVAGESQALGFAAGIVPEPGAWALLIVGFFSVGTVLRSRRSVLTAL